MLELHFALRLLWHDDRNQIILKLSWKFPNSRALHFPMHDAQGREKTLYIYVLAFDHFACLYAFAKCAQKEGNFADKICYFSSEKLLSS